MEKAVALKYDSTLPAPFIVAKGRSELARRIVELAEKNDVPVKTDPDLTERLFVLEAGSLIPEECFRLVAELLVFVQSMENPIRR